MAHTRYRFMVLLLLAAWIWGGIAAPSVFAANSRPNIVVVTVDDLGAHDLSCDGSTLHETPHLDRLASEGVRFAAAYAASPVCTPARAAFMTGKHPARLGMTIWREAAARGPNPDELLLPPRCESNLSRGEVTLAELLQQSGYHTLHVGKWHLGDAQHYPEVHGFAENLGGTLWGAPATFFWPYRGEFGTKSGREIRYVPGLVDGKPDEYLTDRLTDEAIKRLHSIGDQPFFLNLCYHSVHTPIEGKPKLVEHYREKIAAMADSTHRNAEYAAMVHSVDENIGRLLAALGELGVAEDTLLVVTSDNGGYLGQAHQGAVTTNAPLRSGKGSLYEGGIRVPLIVRWPQVTRPGETCSARVVTQDLFSTILEASSAPAITNDGVSLVPLLRQPSHELNRPALYWHFPHYYPSTTPVSAVIRGRHKLLHFYEDDRVELYDLDASPDESDNLASTDPATANELRTLLDNWLEEVGARMPRPNRNVKTATSQPFGGKAQTIPGRVEAEHYDFGAPEVAYHDVEEINLGADYRETTQVDIERRSDASNGHGVGWTRTGEWLRYTVEILEAGVYDIEIPVASNKQGGIFHLEIDGVDITGPIEIPDTGGWKILQTISAQTKRLEPGRFAMRMVMDSQGESGSIGDIDCLQFVRASPEVE